MVLVRLDGVNMEQFYLNTRANRLFLVGNKNKKSLFFGLTHAGSILKLLKPFAVKDFNN